MSKHALALAMLAAAQASDAPAKDLVLERRHDHAGFPDPVRGQRINPKRQAKKATGLKGRQWKKYKKAQQRGRGPLSRAERIAVATSPKDETPTPQSLSPVSEELEK